jgi:hypothetical protein
MHPSACCAAGHDTGADEGQVSGLRSGRREVTSIRISIISLSQPFRYRGTHNNIVRGQHQVLFRMGMAPPAASHTGGPADRALHGSLGVWQHNQLHIHLIACRRPGNCGTYCRKLHTRRREISYLRLRRFLRAIQEEGGYILSALPGCLCDGPTSQLSHHRKPGIKPCMLLSVCEMHARTVEAVVKHRC